jgi:membrane protease YdiL (CAAX protease family)
VNVAATARPLRAILIFLAVVFLGGAVISPWIYQLVLAICGPDSYLGGHPFHRYYGRTVQVLAVLCLWPFLRALGLRSLAELGLSRPRWGRLAAGFGLGFASLAVVAMIGVAVGAMMLRGEVPAAKLSKMAALAAAGAALVAVLEELLFRGALFGGLRRAWSWPFALVVSSAVYALVHFMGKGDGDQVVKWYSGFEMLARLLGGFAHWREIVPGFFNLTLAGAILALAYHRTGNLHFSIGLHAGWIFWLKMCKATTYPAASRSWIWGTAKLVDGWLALLVLAVVLAVVWKWVKPAPEPKASEA